MQNFEKLLQEVKTIAKGITKEETQYNKEYNPTKKEVLKEKLIRLDERIEVYKEILK